MKMALMANSIPNKAKEEKKDGELRLDAEGKGYWHSFKKEKKEEAKEEKKEEPKENKEKKRKRKK